MIKTIHYSSDYLPEVCALLQAGEIVALPTETVYGLAADALNAEAVKKIFAAKERPANHPLIVHIASEAKLNFWAKNIPSIAYKLTQQFWPGPLTLILEKNNAINSVVTGNLNTIALRAPNHPVMQAILTKIEGLAAPSANLFKTISPTTAAHVLKTLDGKIAAVLDDGACTVGLESTILDLTAKKPIILRPGPISKSLIEECLRTEVLEPLSHNTQISGNMAEHYKPTTRAIMVKTGDIMKFLTTTKTIVINYSDLDFTNFNVVSFKIPSNKEDYSKNIYDFMHKADEQNAALIIIEMPPKTNEWSDVLNRLSKATAANML